MDIPFHCTGAGKKTNRNIISGITHDYSVFRFGTTRQQFKSNQQNYTGQPAGSCFHKSISKVKKYARGALIRYTYVFRGSFS